MKAYAVIFDITGIQNYVFGSNKLRENIGASYNVSELFDGYLKKSIKNIGLLTNHFEEWKNNKYGLLKQNPDLKYEVCYVGGGNALLLVDDESLAINLTRSFTKDLLIWVPGISISSTFLEVDYDDFNSSFSNYSQKLFNKLFEAKSSQVAKNVITSYGITAECPRSGYTAEYYYKGINKYISTVTAAKLNAETQAKIKIEKEFSDILKNEYCFTSELDRLWQKRHEDSHIAIVHIDGNNLGKRFQNVKTLEELRRLSIKVEDITKNSFRHLVTTIIDEKDKLLKSTGLEHFPVSDERQVVLPIRPIIIGGDDITFVCDGRLGIYFAKIFIERFEELGKELKSSDKEGLTACGGIAITRTKFPFYRGYILSEELCQNAKKYKKSNDLNGSFIDFQITHQGISDDLENIREREYTNTDGSLIFRPYKIGSQENNGLETLIKNAKYFSKFSKNKIKEFRSCISSGKTEAKEFLIRNTAKDFKLPEFKDKNYHIDVFEDNSTPYFDIIEFIELYPSEYLK